MSYRITERDIWEVDSKLSTDEEFFKLKDFNEIDKYRLQKIIDLALSKEVHWHYDGGLTSYILNH